MDKVIVIGGPGSAVSVGGAIMNAAKTFGNKVELAGILNDHTNAKDINGIPVLGALSTAASFAKEGYKFIFTIYKIGGQPQRIQLFNSLGIPESSFFTFVHPLAYVAPGVQLGAGSVVMPNACVSHNTKIGIGSLIMSNAFIGHDTLIGNHCFVAATSCIGSYITIKDGAWMGFNSTVRGRQKVGRFAAVGVGSVVVSDIPDEEIWIGNPARFHKKVSDPIKH